LVTRERGQAGRGRTTVLAEIAGLAEEPPLSVTTSADPSPAAAERRRQIDVGSTTSVAEGRSRPCCPHRRGPQVDALGAVDVHHDIAGAAEEAQARR
jgi:hypothetical protein